MNNNHRALYKGEEVTVTKITEENLEECKKNIKDSISSSNGGCYGHLEIGKYMFWTGLGFEYCYLIVNENDIILLD